MAKFQRKLMMFHIGQGFDVHKLVPDRPLILGGVSIPWEFGLLGHSDADVLTHAVIDALLGALALGDIGTWFPDSDPKYKNADSLKLLSKVLLDKNFQAWKLLNLDATVIAQEPKLSQYIPEMRKNLSVVFSVDETAVSIKATTTEGLGFCGRGEGIAAMATVLISNSK